MDIIFLRHGETYHNRTGTVQGHTDTTLTARGKRQAKQVGEVLRDEFLEVDRVYSSDLQRAKTTAEALDLDAPIETDARFRELDFGDVTHESLSEFIENNPEYDAEQPYALLTRFPNGESTMDVYDRVTDALMDVTARHDDDAMLVIVGHHTSLCTALAFAEGEGIGFTKSLEVPTGSGFHATVDNGEWIVNEWPKFVELSTINNPHESTED